MHQTDAWAMDGGPRTFRAGAAAFRNLRDYAEEQRNSAIQRANERAQKIDDDAVDEVDSDDLQAGSSDAPFNFAGGAPVDKQECQTLEAGL